MLRRVVRGYVFAAGEVSRDEVSSCRLGLCWRPAAGDVTMRVSSTGGRAMTFRKTACCATALLAVLTFSACRAEAGGQSNGLSGQGTSFSGGNTSFTGGNTQLGSAYWMRGGPIGAGQRLRR